MPFDIGALAQETAGGIIGTGLGLMLENHNDTRQIRQQGKLQQQQIRGQKEMTDYQMMKQLEMWKNTNYSAQMEELRKAGLNPGLLYGMSGGGGTTTGSASGNVTGGTAPQGGGETLAGAGMGMQLALLGAQKANIEADTKKKEIEAEKTAGVDTTKTQTEIESLTQGITNAKVQAELTKVQTRLAQLDETIVSGTVEERIDRVVWESQRVLEDLETVNRNNYINKATQNAQIDIVRRTAIGALLKNALTQAETGNVKQDTKNKEMSLRLDKQRISNMAQEIQIDWQELSYEQRKVRVIEELKDMNLEIQGVDQLIRGISEIFEGFGKGVKPNRIINIHENNRIK